MKRGVLLFVILILFSSCYLQKHKNKRVYKELLSLDYDTYNLDTSNVIIDERTFNEYEKSHIERAINVSYFGGKFKNKVKKLNDTFKTILLYYQIQHRSLLGSNKLYK